MVCGLIPPEPAQASRVSLAGDRFPVHGGAADSLGVGHHTLSPRVKGVGFTTLPQRDSKGVVYRVGHDRNAARMGALLGQ